MIAAGLIEEGEPFELIGGELVAMSPKGRHHELLRIDLNVFWIRRLPDDIMVAPETSFRLADHDEPEPGFMAYPASPLAPDVRGDTVLLVAEISDSSLSKDLNTKAAQYASFGVREYWVINVITKETTVHREPGPDGYASIRNVAGDVVLIPHLVPALAVRLDDLGQR